MIWIAPEITRADPAAVADERTSLDSYLEHERQTLLWKCGGLTAEQLAARSVGRSSLSLLGIVRHLAGVERWWFRQNFAGEQLDMIFYTEADPNQDFDGIDPQRAEADYATYLYEVDQARRAVAGHSLDETFHRPSGELVTLRWLYLRMIAEYARHAGHADLLREHIDGQTGD